MLAWELNVGFGASGVVIPPAVFVSGLRPYGGRVVLQTKFLGETKKFLVDFISNLAASETISTQIVTASVYSGVDASPSSIISGAASASGTQVSQAITAGVVGVVYELLYKIT